MNFSRNEIKWKANLRYEVIYFQFLARSPKWCREISQSRFDKHGTKVSRARTAVIPDSSQIFYFFMNYIRDTTQ